MAYPLDRDSGARLLHDTNDDDAVPAIDAIHRLHPELLHRDGRRIALLFPPPAWMEEVENGKLRLAANPSVVSDSRSMDGSFWLAIKPDNLAGRRCDNGDWSFGLPLPLEFPTAERDHRNLLASKSWSHATDLDSESEHFGPLFY